ncbi:cation:proton antiporter domain-containing protein, partial [Streptomyces lunaelactis]|uniref:cation:proton antiporter domain-containing protein n=1 Tax=Streptomyces lunaelactis TaxID=1535768 RepID=UPI001584E104|nr:cation:proton antiporter [Streptomyces lunaelactis]
PGDLPSVLWPVLAAVAVTVVMNVCAGMATARIYAFGPKATANIYTTLLARGEFALLLATMAEGAGLDERLSLFIAGYVLLLAVLSPLAAGRSHWLARILPGGSARDPDNEKEAVPV